MDHSALNGKDLDEAAILLLGSASDIEIDHYGFVTDNLEQVPRICMRYTPRFFVKSATPTVS